jgi:hypothetical protein
MTITLEFPTEEAEILRRQAERVGKELSVYVHNTMASMIVPQRPPLTNEEWERLADEAASIVPSNVPPLSDYAVSRESIYGDHD